MNKTPTPRTDKKKFIFRRTPRFPPTLPKEVVLASVSETLERELMAMTEQRDEALKEIDLLKTNLRIQTEHTENAVQDRADEHIELHNQIYELTEQREAARAEVELLKKTPLRQRCQELERLSEHFCDMHTVAAKQRDEAREQRDRLAEALRKAILWGESASHRIFDRENINWTYLNEAKEALHSLNQPT